MKPNKWVRPVEDMNKVAVPDFDDYFEQLGEWESEIRLHLCFETARGCWWGMKKHCTFCGLNGSTMAFRSKSVERAVAELEYLLERYGQDHDITLLRSVDQILDMGYFKGFVQGLAGLNNRVPIYYETKSNLNREQILGLKAANIKLIQPGIESLNTPILNLMKKGCTMLQNIQLLKWCTDVGILALWNMLYGFPGEDPKDYQEMATIIPALTHLQPPTNIYKIRLVRFSPYYNQPEEYGIINVRPYKGYYHLYPGITKEILDLRAYRFDYDFGDGRDLAYVQVAMAEVRHWMEAKGRGALVGFPKEEGLLIWDERALSLASWTQLDAIHAAILDYCDQIRSLNLLKKFIEKKLGFSLPEEGLHQLLEPLEYNRYLLREEKKLLSLVILKKENIELMAPPNTRIIHSSVASVL